MTALEQFERLEATALWRESATAQRREVIVSLGSATITLTTMSDAPLTHWSLAALTRQNGEQIPAIYAPDGTPDETLEISDIDMVDAIERIRAAIQKQHPRTGRLRWLVRLGTVAALVAAAVFWVPGALVRHTATVIPEATRQQISRALLDRFRTISGQPCNSSLGLVALTHLNQRLDRSARLVVMASGTRQTLHLPDGTVLIDRALVEDFDDPDALAGFILAEDLRFARRDPMLVLLENAGLWAALQLLTRGSLPDQTLQTHAEMLVRHPLGDIPFDQLLERFKSAQLRSTPYAYAVDPTGETTLPLIEADPNANGQPPALLSDGDWISLQEICGR